MESASEQLADNIAQGNQEQLELLASANPTKRAQKKKRDWTDDESSALLESVISREFRSVRKTRSNILWNPLVESMKRKFGGNSEITVKRCKDRMKTLTGVKYYKRVTSAWERRQAEGNFTKDDLHGLIMLGGMKVDWYDAIKEYNALNQGTSQMQMDRDLDRNVPTNCPPRSRTPTATEPFQPIQATTPQSARESELEMPSQDRYSGSYYEGTMDCYLDRNVSTDCPPRPRTPTATEPFQPIQATTPHSAGESELEMTHFQLLLEKEALDEWNQIWQYRMKLMRDCF